VRSKLPQVGTTIFSTMSALAAEYGSLNMGQGFPSFPMDQRLIDLVHKAMTGGKNQYAPMPGVLSLRQRIAHIYHKQHDAAYDPQSQITVTAGATQAIFTAISALVHPEDEVILFAPAYDCYAPAVELQGGKCVWMNLQWPDYSIQWDHLKKLINHKTRMIILNTPHNPSGRTLSDQDMRTLEHLLDGTDIVLLSDEVYEHLIFDAVPHCSAARYPGLFSRAMIVGSFGKTLHCTGWKTGYIAGPEHLMIEFRKVHQYNVFVANTPIQHAIAEYLEDPTTYTALGNYYQEKRDLFRNGLKESPWELNECQGTYFQNLRLKVHENISDIALAQKLTIMHKITGIPCSVFYPDHLDEGVLRFCFAKTNTEIEQACEILNKVIL
jgi:methionine transaminase